MTAKTDEFSVITPIAESVHFRGSAVSVSPLKVGQLPRFARAIKSIDSAAFGAVIDGDIDGIVTLFADHGEAMIDAVAIASGVPADTIADSDLDEVVRLAAVIVRVNSDFFARRLTPAITDLTRQAQQRNNGDGQTPSTP